MEFEPVIGLEVHAQLSTRTKIFCGCATKFGALPNTHVCPVCLGMPGALPVLNRKVVEYTIKMALATHCRVAENSRFARKNYFYPDLPKNYQISQYELPLAEHGHLDIRANGEKKKIGITRIHMEEDAGKLVHDPDRPVSRVDLNRTGVPLMEIVSEPDLRSAKEAVAYLKSIRSILRYIGISDGNMQEGSFRCDANVSIRPGGTTTLGTRAELKNLNSFKFVGKAILHEIARQREVLLDGGQVIQETRLYDPDKDVTRSMRGKEEAHDYRYFPDPDLPPITVDEDWIARIRRTLPELPDAKKKRYIEGFGLSEYDADMLTTERETAEYFEACVQGGVSPKASANWIMGPLTARLNADHLSISDMPVSPAALSELLKLLKAGTINTRAAKTVFEDMVDTGRPAGEIVEQKGLVQVSDLTAIEAVVDKILAANSEQVQQYKGGKTRVLGFFVGRVMRVTRGKANPKIVNEVLTEKLGA